MGEATEEPGLVLHTVRGKEGAEMRSSERDLVIDRDK